MGVAGSVTDDEEVSDEIVRRPSAWVALVMGGFHLGNSSRDRIEGIIADLRLLGVRRVAPCHCTGHSARRLFADGFGDDCVLAGVGYTVKTGPGGME